MSGYQLWSHSTTMRLNRPSGGRTWWANYEFTRINIELTILLKKIEAPRVMRAFASMGECPCSVMDRGAGRPEC